MWGLKTVHGEFKDFVGSFEVGEGSAAGEIQIVAASLDTKNAMRDRHLRSDHFFGAHTHPRIVFVITHATGGAARLEISGELTVRGATRAVNFVASADQSTPLSVIVSTSFDVDRTEFGMSWNPTRILTGRATVSVTAHMYGLR
jgi:polyisoprenoid-binding protein YceI